MSAETITLEPETTPSRENAEQAVRTLLAYFGENPDREGLLDTPRRFVDAYEEFLAGYKENPTEILSRTFEEVEGYDDIVLLKDIRIESHCEHHIQPLIGFAHVAYLPSDKVVGISKIARVVDAYSRRLQSQEILTNQIANAIETALKAPRRRRDHRRQALLHDDTRRTQDRCLLRHPRHERRFQRRCKP